MVYMFLYCSGSYVALWVGLRNNQAGSNAMGANGTGHNLPNGHNSSVPTSSEHVPSGGGPQTNHPQELK
eukprot:2997288-Amphidinium_carterae.1